MSNKQKKAIPKVRFYLCVGLGVFIAGLAGLLYSRYRDLNPPCLPNCAHSYYSLDRTVLYVGDGLMLIGVAIAGLSLAGIVALKRKR